MQLLRFFISALVQKRSQYFFFQNQFFLYEEREKKNDKARKVPPGFWRVERFYRCPTEHARRQRREETRKKNEEPLLHLCLSKAFVLPRDPGEFPPARARYKKKENEVPRGCVIIISIITTTATTTTIRTRARLNNNNLYERYQSPCGRDGFFFSAFSRKRRRRRRRSALMSERTQKRVGSNASTIQKQHVVIITNDDDDDNGRTSVYKQNVMRKIFTTRTPTPLIYLFLRDKKCVVCI